AQTVQTLEDHHIYVLLGGADEDSYSATFMGEGAPEWATETGGLPNINFGFPYNNLIDPANLGAWSAFFANADAPNGIGLENEYAQMWEYVANYFNGNPDIVGYEIMDEPWAGLSWPLTVLGSPAFGAQQLTPFFDQVTAAMRAVDPTTPVYTEPNLLYELGLTPITQGTVDYPHVVFGFEDYCVLGIFGITAGCGALTDAVANRAVAYADAHNIPALLEEFGAGDNQTINAEGVHAADQNLIGWSYWTFTGQGDITTTSSPSSLESLVYNPSQPPVGANVNTATLDTLAEPYPQTVSGTPNSFSFDDGVFRFSYSVEKPDGVGSFPVGSQTTIAVPAIDFPHGYEVAVTGGQVVSAPDAPQLVIVSTGSAHTVEVTVSPAGVADGAAPTVSGSSVSGVVGWFDREVYAPLHAGLEDWISDTKITVTTSW
ncbi:cellulase family glycosylhydrolase, partial [Mycobacterium sp.]|uniref:glycoside hydrolase family 5 protein n=1 Tax=Mycobacterium sp. TaxID=1785 RepID=UPI00127DAB85